MKEITDRLNFIKIKTVCFVKAVKTKIRQARELEKYLEKMNKKRGVLHSEMAVKLVGFHKNKDKSGKLNAIC